MKHYLAVVAPRPEGGWHAHIPDFPECGGTGTSLEIALTVASAAPMDRVRALRDEGRSLPQPRSYGDLRNRHDSWARDRGIHWGTAVVSLVPLAV